MAVNAGQGRQDVPRDQKGAESMIAETVPHNVSTLPMVEVRCQSSMLRGRGRQMGGWVEGGG